MDYTIHTHTRPDKGAYCGPTVLHLLTGEPFEKLYAQINRLYNKYGKKKTRRIKGDKWDSYRYAHTKFKMKDKVGGMHNRYLVEILDRYRFNPKVIHVKKSDRLTLRALAEDREFVSHPCVVVASNHYLLIYKGMVYDTFRRQGAPASEHPYARRKVYEIIELEKRRKK